MRPLQRCCQLFSHHLPCRGIVKKKFPNRLMPFMSSTYNLLAAVFFCLALPANSFCQSNDGQAPTTTFPPPLVDDLNFTDLAKALEYSLSYYENHPDIFFSLHDQELTGKELAHAYHTTITYLNTHSSHDNAHFLANNFIPSPGTPLLVTAYYSPAIAGSLTPSDKFPYPLYKLPTKEKLHRARRADIENGHLLQGLEIAYLSNPLDVFFLHIQGSGFIHFGDGSQRLIHYAGDNGRPYTSIGKVLINQGKLTKEEVSMASIRHYLINHPQDVSQILHSNERFIFFKLEEPSLKDDKVLPSGSLGYPLTPGRSVAMDADHYPPGTLGILTSRIPHFNKEGSISWQPMSRLVTHQDSGAAIKGPHRLDLYLGDAPGADKVAGVMKEKGNFTILIPNLSLRRVRSKISASHPIYHTPEPQSIIDTASGE